jgi:hypothetical protein
MPRRISMTAAVERELKNYPADIRLGSTGRGMMLIAQRLDAGVDDDDHLKHLLTELRLSSAQLRDRAPGETPGDEVDAARKRRENQMTRMAGEQG